jgi:uncharacterized C2H2 Zn-finger protein
MPKLVCPCGFVHDLSPIPDDGWRAIRDKDWDLYVEHERTWAEGYGAPSRSPQGEAVAFSGREMLRMGTLLYECPQCGRIMWRKAYEEDYHIYLPEDEVTRVQALALAVAADFERVEGAVRAEVRTEAIRIHNQAARILAQRMASDGLQCPHCFESSKQMQLVERGPGVWSFFQCPACSRTFRLGKSGFLKDSELWG